MPFTFPPPITSSTGPSGFGQTSNSNVFPTVPLGSQCISAQNCSTMTIGSSTPSSTTPIPFPIMWGGSSAGSTSSSTSAFAQSSNANVSAPTNEVTSMGVSGMTKAINPFTDSKTDASGGKESKQQPKLQCDEMEKSVQLICKDIIRHQEDMKSWIERYRSLELEKIEDTRVINQLREDVAQLTKSKDVIIAEYLESPAFTKRLDEEHEKRLSEIFHPSYVKAVRTVQTKLPKKSKRRKNRVYVWHRADQVIKKEQEEKEKTST